MSRNKKKQRAVNRTVSKKTETYKYIILSAFDAVGGHIFQIYVTKLLKDGDWTMHSMKLSNKQNSRQVRIYPNQKIDGMFSLVKKAEKDSILPIEARIIKKECWFWDMNYPLVPKREQTSSMFDELTQAPKMIPKFCKALLT